ncbi:MAG TPA: hypothetical protein VF412_09545 [Bdellovibrio sp.]|uniref:hypothetical protein n=1 Tax=Bdellovibrio sp. TaxID=28201 RepID=UPI002F1F0B27
MELPNKITLVLLASLLPLGCGVKGLPLPPLTPPPIGRGEPTYSEATQKSSKKKSVKPDIDDDTNAPSEEIEEGL